MAKANVVRIAGLTHLAEDLTAATESFLNCRKSMNCSPNTIVYYQNRFRAFAGFLDRKAPGTRPIDVTPQLVRAFLTDEMQSKSPSTANHSYIALNALFGFLVNDGFMADNPLSRVEQPRRRKTVIDTFSMEQLETLVNQCGRDFTGTRDRAMMLLMLDSGLRVSELCGITLDDVNWTEQTVLVLGKGDRERIVPFGCATRQALSSYLVRRGNLSTRVLFVTCYGEPVDRYRARRIIQARCEKAGITSVRCSPHTFRHTMAVSYLRNGGDVFSLQKMLGHTDLAMTRRVRRTLTD